MALPLIGRGYRPIGLRFVQESEGNPQIKNAGAFVGSNSARFNLPTGLWRLRLTNASTITASLILADGTQVLSVAAGGVGEKTLWWDGTKPPSGRYGAYLSIPNARQNAGAEFYLELTELSPPPAP